MSSGRRWNGCLAHELATVRMSQPQPTILFNGESLAPPLTGIGNYAYQLIQHVSAPGSGFDAACFRNGSIRPARAVFDELSERSPEQVWRRERTMAWLHVLADRTTFPYHLHQWRTRRAFRRSSARLEGPVLYHEPNYVLKPFDGPSITTVHDLSVFRYPQFHPASRVRFLESQLGKSLERADRIVTDSALIGREVEDSFGIPAEKIEPIELGVSPAFRPLDAPACRAVMSRFDLQYDGFVLCVSTFEPRKNLNGLLDAYALLPESLRGRFPLVLVGARGWLSRELDARVERLVLRGQVRRLGFVSDDMLPVIYAAARVFCLPSVYEGFGLPALEAMAAGTATVVGRGTTMEEFARGAARLAEVTDPESICAEVKLLLEDDVERAVCCREGLRLARELTWERCAGRHMNLYRTVLEERMTRTD